jgi:TRAP-type uncharacterized transport system substrate-binding protein
MKSFLHPISRSIAAAALLCCAVPASQAQEGKPDASLRIAGGPSGKVYELMVRDMQTVCGTTVPVHPVTSSGGLQNLSLLSANEAELGIVQVDVLREMRSGDENMQALQSVTPLHNNLLHVLTLTGGSLVDPVVVKGVKLPLTGHTVVVQKFSQLKGLTVAVVGSAQLMGQTLEKQLAYGMRFVVAESDDQAVALLRAGQVQAIFTLGGWPLPSVARHKTGSGLQLAEYDLAPQAPYLSVKRNYQDLDAFNLKFLGVPNLLVTRPFRSGGAMAGRVAALQHCLRQHLDELQEGRYQPAWKEVKDSTQHHGVAPFAPGLARLSTK